MEPIYQEKKKISNHQGQHCRLQYNMSTRYRHVETNICNIPSYKNYRWYTYYLLVINLLYKIKSSGHLNYVFYSK